MHNTSDSNLLMIEPTGTVAATPIIDSLTRRMTYALRNATTPMYGYRGVHAATGVYPDGIAPHSDNVDHHVACVDGNMRITNSLAVHYLAYFRDDVPAEELEKLDRVLRLTEAEPTPDELWPGRPSVATAARERVTR